MPFLIPQRSRPLRSCCRTAALAMALTVTATLGMAATAAAQARPEQAKLEADYVVTLAGIPIGSGGWIVDVSSKRYAIEVNAKTSQFVSIFASGTGAAAVRGVVNGSRLVPNDFAMNIATRSYRDEIKMGLTGGTVHSLSVEPPPRARSEDHVPLTDVHKRAVVDPFSAGVLPSPTGGPTPEVCSGTLAVFDGRQRFDLTLSYKRMETVKSEEGYSGPVVVCGVAYEPLGGFNRNRTAIRYLRESRDIEMWYAPVAGTSFVATYRASIPTTIGTAVLQAKRFVISGPERRAEGPAPRARAAASQER